MEEQAIVKEAHGHRALVEVQRSALCEGCHAKGSCTLIPDTGLRTVWADNPSSAKEGDSVVLFIEDLRVLKGSFIFYLIPVFSLVIGAVIGKTLAGVEALTTVIEDVLGSSFSGLLTNADNLAVMAGISFLLMSFAAIWIYSRHASKSGEFRPRISRIICEAD